MKPLLYLAFMGLLASCNGPVEPEETFHPGEIWKKYDQYSGSQPLIDPEGYISYLKATKFPNGELDSLPEVAIILFDSRIIEFLDSLGYEKDEIQELQIGTTDPNLLYVVDNDPPKSGFIICSGLPGAGGVSTQLAEFGALGVKNIVHIGTCGLFGTRVNDESVIISSGAYMDGGSALLSNHAQQGEVDYLALPDTVLSNRILNNALSEKMKVTHAYGLTIPVFYFQPAAMFTDILKMEGSKESPKPEYIEMEGSAAFLTGNIMKLSVASVQLPTDRYVLKDDSPDHSFIDYDADSLKLKVLDVVINTLLEEGG